MRKLAFLAFMLVILCVQSSSAQEREYAASFELNGLYAPTRIVMQFVYAANVTGPIDVRTLSGRSLWTAQISPVSFEFMANDVDTYTFDMYLHYNATMQQILQISYWSGNLAPFTENIKIKEQDVWLHFNLIVSTQPSFPTKEELAEQVVIQVKQDLADYMSQVSLLAQAFEENIMVMWAVIGGSIVSSIMSLIVAFYAIRSSHQEKRR